MSENEVLYVKSSKGKNAASSDDGSSYEDDVWDDSLLIAAYDKAVDLAHSKATKNMPSDNGKSKVKAKKRNPWKVGDQCRCEFGKDRAQFEADIIDIIDDLEMCIVKYVGYGIEEKVLLNKLKPSKGEKARSVQMKQALEENDGKDVSSVEGEPELGNHPKSGKKNGSTKGEKTGSKENLVPGNIPPSSPLHKPSMLGAIPPPPPPHIFDKVDDNPDEADAMSAMLMSWYMSGYHTGYYQGLKAASKK